MQASRALRIQASRAAQMPILKRSSYYDSDYRATAALIRARRPYIFKNAITGVVIASFAIGVFAFTLQAVGQETFEDVIVPDRPQGVAQQQSLQQGGVQSGAVVGQGLGQGVQQPRTGTLQR